MADTPLGKAHTVRQGETLITIASAYRGSVKGIWEHKDNAELKAKRPCPNILFPGDVVKVPAGGRKTLRIKLGGDTVVSLGGSRTQPVNLTLQDPAGEPLKNKPYTATFGPEDKRQELSGETTSEGKVCLKLPINVGLVTLEAERFTWRLQVGFLNPVKDTPDEGVSGAQGRLVNLGYKLEINGRPDEATQAALRAFQKDQRITESGELDAATQDKLTEIHGC